jgi:hypothetical protein
MPACQGPLGDLAYENAAQAASARAGDRLSGRPIQPVIPGAACAA